MVGMRSEADILKAFEGLDKRPGSRHARVTTSTAAEKRRAKILKESNGWDTSPIMRSLGGEAVEFFTISALAQALDKEVVTIRYWERKGYIPTAPYRLRSKTLQGKKVNGNRVYTRELINITIEEFAKRNLLGSARVEWKHYDELTTVLVDRWRDASKREQ